MSAHFAVSNEFDSRAPDQPGALNRSQNPCAVPRPLEDTLGRRRPAVLLPAAGLPGDRRAQHRRLPPVRGTSRRRAAPRFALRHWAALRQRTAGSGARGSGTQPFEAAAAPASTRERRAPRPAR